MNCRMAPGNGVVRAWRPKGSLYHPSGPSRLRITVELMSTTRWQSRNADELMAAFSVVTYWYPSVRKPYYLKAGLGMVTYRIDDGTDRLTSSALGPQIGAGWDLPVGARVSVIPYVNLLFASTGALLKFNGAPFLDGASLELFQVGLGLARRSEDGGRRRRTHL